MNISPLLFVLFVVLFSWRVASQSRETLRELQHAIDYALSWKQGIFVGWPKILQNHAHSNYSQSGVLLMETTRDRRRKSGWSSLPVNVTNTNIHTYISRHTDLIVFGRETNAPFSRWTSTREGHVLCVFRVNSILYLLPSRAEHSFHSKLSKE